MRAVFTFCWVSHSPESAGESGSKASEDVYFYSCQELVIFFSDYGCFETVSCLPMSQKRCGPKGGILK